MTEPQNNKPPGNGDSSKDNGYTPGDDFATQWRNIFSYMSGRMTDQGQEQFRVARDQRNEAADCKRCEDQLDYLLQYSMLQFVFMETCDSFAANANDASSRARTQALLSASYKTASSN